MAIKKNMDPIMVDLETLGTSPNSAILSIGAVKFDPNTKSLTDEFYVVINKQSCLDAGMTVNDDTLAWWNRQNAEAKKVLILAETSPITIQQALEKFASFAHYNSCVWGNGSDFDNAMVQEAYKKIGRKQPWAFWNNRCYRTMKNMFPNIEMRREGTYHNALDDAKSQAFHLMDILAYMRMKVA